MLVKMVDTDPRSTTCQNLRYLRRVTSLEHPELYSSWRIREELPSKCVPDGEKWRLGLLARLLEMKKNKFVDVQDSHRNTAMNDLFPLHLWVTPTPTLFGAHLGARMMEKAFIFLIVELLKCSNKSYIYRKGGDGVKPV